MHPIVDRCGYRDRACATITQPTENQVAFKFTRKQFPVRLCFAMTINKSQRQSVDHVGLNFRSPVFANGQFYCMLGFIG